jgi:glutamate carboxypeptidase
MPNLPDYFRLRQSQLLDLIRALVERETPSRDAARLDEIAAFIGTHLRDLGGDVNLISAPGYGTHLRARFFGAESYMRAENPDDAQLLVVGHLDTVWPLGTLERLPWRVTPEGAAHGPGVFDMKSGIAVLVESLRALVSLGIKTRRPATLLLTCDEEIGSRTSRDLIESEARCSRCALVCEPPVTGGIVKTSRKGVGDFTIRAVGRAAHAGLDPAKGVNAIVELAHQTLRLAALNDFERGTTVSVGTIRGGTASNVIPAEAVARVDLRFWDPEEGERIVNTIKNLAPALPEARLEITGGINRPPMRRTPEIGALYQHARSLAAELGFELGEAGVGGGSDGNFTAALGVPTLDGLGVDGAGAHADHEHILIEDLPRRAALITRLLQTL